MTEAEKADDSVETKADKEENRLSAEEVAADGKAFLQEVLDKMGIPVMIEKMIKEERIIFIYEVMIWVFSSVSTDRPWMHFNI